MYVNFYQATLWYMAERKIFNGYSIDVLCSEGCPYVLNKTLRRRVGECLCSDTFFSFRARWSELWASSLPGRRHPQGQDPSTPWIGWVGSRAILHAVKTKMSTSAGESNYEYRVVQPTPYTIPPEVSRLPLKCNTQVFWKIPFFIKSEISPSVLQNHTTRNSADQLLYYH
jgi:hypothetical protein